MSVEKVDTLVVGAGQAGIAMSEHLGKLGVPHLVLEKKPRRRSVAVGALGLSGCERSGLA